MPTAAVLDAMLLVMLSALNPGVLVVSAVYLGRNSDTRLESVFLVTGLIVSLLVGVAVLVVVRSTGLALPTKVTPRYGLRLGLGILALVLAAVLPWLDAHKQRRAAAKGPGKPSLASRMMGGAAVGGAVVVGILIYSPGVAYLSGVQGIASAESDVTPAVLFLVLAAVVNVSVAIIYLTAYVRAPDRTTAHLTRANGWISWIQDHKEVVSRVVLVVAGVYLVITSSIGLAST